MYKLWGKIIKDNKIIRTIVIENNDTSLSDMEQRKECLEQICYEFDIPYPLWFPYNEQDYKSYQRTAFNQDHFMETIEFDKLEIEVIDLDKDKKK